MRLAVFGATATSGTAVLGQALAAGHCVRVLARTPTKITRADPALTVIAGNAKDPVAVAETMTGCSAVITALGGFADTDSIRIGTDVITRAMRDAASGASSSSRGSTSTFPAIRTTGAARPSCRCCGWAAVR